MSPSNSRLGPTGPKVLSNPALQKEKRSHQTRPAQLPTPRKPQPGSTGDRDLETPARCTARSRDRQTLTPAPNGAGTRKARRGDSGSGSGTLWTLRTQLRAAEPAGPRSLLRARAGETPPPALRRRNCARAPRPRLRGTRGAGPGERVRAPSVCGEDGDQPRISRHPL